MRWDVFCRVIDNWGDVGVCWRLAADLGARGQAVRLWLDDAAPLAWMAPGGAPGVTVLPWPVDDGAEPGDVVIEAFGCDPPPAFVQRMAQADRPPVWINLEYLSAEAYVERSHGLPSPQAAGPGRGLTKHFFYPGFTPATGGLLREPGLAAEHQHFDAAAWWAGHGGSPRPGERSVLLFCYDNPALPALLQSLADEPVRLLVTPGLAAQQVRALQQAGALPGRVRPLFLPPLPQADFDRLLWSTDLNLVRGEDSLVRALWAGPPFLWQLYPQHDGAHVAKLQAFVDLWLGGPVAAEVGALFHGWNGLRDLPRTPVWPLLPAWRSALSAWRARLLRQADLTTALIAFVATRRGAV